MNSAEWNYGRAAISEMNFDRILDDACGRLLEKKTELSIKRLRELEALLAGCVRELNEFIAEKDRHGRHP
ncbi:MAG: hypothetical protein LBC88_09145 [Spirochaetaceae bacterium]|jgi:hypothetical protein|nr:hypothetical protein [Spirochaetaceae bacterium]